jgi:hypothetical protein
VAPPFEFAFDAVMMALAKQRRLSTSNIAPPSVTGIT